jgi:hypothetical protein
MDVRRVVDVRRSPDPRSFGREREREVDVNYLHGILNLCKQFFV